MSPSKEDRLEKNLNFSQCIPVSITDTIVGPDSFSFPFANPPRTILFSKSFLCHKGLCTMYIYIYTYIGTYIHIGIYIYTHRHIYIHTHTLFFPKLFILIVQGLCCCAQALVVESGGFLFVAMTGLLTVVASLVQHRL